MNQEETHQHNDVVWGDILQPPHKALFYKPGHNWEIIKGINKKLSR